MKNTQRPVPLYRCALDAHPRVCLSSVQIAELQGKDVALECKNHGEAWGEVGYFKWNARFEDWLPCPDFGARKEVSDADC